MLSVVTKALLTEQLDRIFREHHQLVYRTAYGVTGSREDAQDVFAVVGATPQPTSSPSVFAALEEQLGLKLEPAREKVEVFAIQSVDKPSEN